MEHMRLVLVSCDGEIKREGPRKRSSIKEEHLSLSDLDFSFINPQHNITCIPGSLENSLYSVRIYILKSPCPLRALFTIQLIYSSPGPSVLGYLFIFMLNGLQKPKGLTSLPVIDVYCYTF